MLQRVLHMLALVMVTVLVGFVCRKQEMVTALSPVSHSESGTPVSHSGGGTTPAGSQSPCDWSQAPAPEGALVTPFRKLVLRMEGVELTLQRDVVGRVAKNSHFRAWS